MTATPFRIPTEYVRWVRDRTVIRCFDDDGHEVAALDGSTGLAWTLNGDEWAVDESVLPPGRWVFDGVYLLGYGAGERHTAVVHDEGVSDSDGTGYAAVLERLEAMTESPWEYVAAPRIFATWAQRQERITICRACPLYDHESGACTVDESFMVNKTIDASQECPEGKWGVTDDFDPAEAERRSQRSVVMVPAVGPLEDQQQFEAEWEARRVRG